jgi:hypothetical protein
VPSLALQIGVTDPKRGLFEGRIPHFGSLGGSRALRLDATLHYAYLSIVLIEDTWVPSPCKRLSRFPWWGVTPTTTTNPPSP